MIGREVLLNQVVFFFKPLCGENNPCVTQLFFLFLAPCFDLYTIVTRHMLAHAWVAPNTECPFRS